MSTLEDRYFDLCLKVVNYGMEFLNQPGYASLRLTDLLDALVRLAPEISGVDKNEFYEKVSVKLENRRAMSTQQDRGQMLNDILSMFVEEWRKSI